MFSADRRRGNATQEVTGIPAMCAVIRPRCTSPYSYPKTFGLRERMSTEVSTRKPCMGEVRGNTVNGSVNVSTTSWAEVSTVNGSVHASMGDAAWKGSLKISSVNGAIELRMPDDLNADVSFNSVNGSLSSDFPLTISSNWPVGHTAKGQVGRGGRELVIQTVNGSVQLRKGGAG